MNRLEAEILRQIDEAETVEFLQRLIQAPSPAPPGDTRAVAQLCAAQLRQAGAEVQMAVLDETLPSVVGTLAGANAGPVLALHAHIDTVPVEDLARWQCDPFAGSLVDGRIYGRGAGDCKGSAAAQIMALTALARAGVQLKGTLQVAAASDEEEGGKRGSKYLHDDGYLQPDYLIVGEQTSNCVAIGERATGRYEITVRGVAAHGATPWQGVSAITKMARLICYLEDIYGRQLEARVHPYLPHSSMNIGTIQGGLKANMVPEVCQIRIDRRILPDETPYTAEAELRQMVERFASEVEEIDCEVKLYAIPSWPSVQTDPGSTLVQTLQATLRELTGEERSLTGYNQGSDARFWVSAGIPIVIFGPGDPALGHAPNECLSVGELLEATQVYALTAVRLLGVCQ